MDADGSDQTRLTNNTTDDFKPDWGPLACTIEGTEGNDVLVGTSGNGVIRSLGANDTKAAPTTATRWTRETRSVTVKPDLQY